MLGPLVRMPDDAGTARKIIVWVIRIVLILGIVTAIPGLGSAMVTRLSGVIGSLLGL